MLKMSLIIAAAWTEEKYRSFFRYIGIVYLITVIMRLLYIEIIKRSVLSKVSIKEYDSSETKYIILEIII